jgi:ectoine hydroxylase-related dioxygenase (phytanoyl-CoA dioxygenase family)
MLAPGSQAEPLHRHDDIYFADHPLSQPVEIWALWSGGPEGNTTENGCVEGIIGSHTWGEDWDPAGHVLASTEMKTGSCLLLHGSLVHRGGANQSGVLRRSIGASWTQGHLRQEENQVIDGPGDHDIQPSLVAITDHCTVSKHIEGEGNEFG